MIKSASPFVFLSYSRADLSFINRLKADLHEQGISAWIDHEQLQPGTSDWEEALRVAIRASSGVLLIASPNARISRYVKDELRIAEMYQRPVYPLWIAGRAWMEAVPIGWGSIQHIDAREERYSQAVRDLVRVLEKRIALPAAQVSPPTQDITLPSLPRNPYKGLRPFRSEDARDFFGRNRLIQELVQAIQQVLVAEQQDAANARLLTVIGPSGSGKSSVMMAGLLPQLQQGVLPGSDAWTYLEPIVPGKHPLEALSLMLSSKFPTRSLTSIREDLEGDSARGLHLLIASLMKKPEAKAVLLIDQFEEVFAQTSTEDERGWFLDLLITAITEPGGPVIAMLTLRGDFYDRPLHYPELGRLIKDHHMVVLPMEMKDLRAVIEQPAQLPDVDLTFEDDLVGDLLFDVQGQNGALPLLQFTLDQLFQQRNERQLTVQAYREIGGVKGALAQHAESTYLSLPSEEHQRLARALFLRLIDAGTVDQDATKRRAPLSELVVTDPIETMRLGTITRTFTAARLLITNTVAGVPTVEVSHEALIREWTRLTNWLHESREDIRLQKVISEDAAEWERHGKPVDRLYWGSQLTEAQAWKARNISSLDEEAFLQASLIERERQEAAEQIRQEQEKQRQRRYTRRTVLVGAAGLGLTVAAFTVRGLLLPKNVAPGQTPPTLKLPYTYLGHKDTVESVAWSPDGKWLASASADRTVQVWSTSTGHRLFTYKSHTDDVHCIAWSPDSKRIASASFDKTVQVWEASTGKRLLTYTGHTDYVNSVIWSPDGKRIASAGDDAKVQIWDASSGRYFLTYTGRTTPVVSASWSPDGRRIASIGFNTNTVEVWDAVTGNFLLAYKGHVTPVSSIAWSPDGNHIASAGESNTVEVWDPTTGNLLLVYKGRTSYVYNMAWSPNGKWLASAGYEKIVEIWNTSTGRLLFTYKGHTAPVYDVTWSPDGKRIASAAQDTTVQVWEARISIGRLVSIYKGHTDEVDCVAWSPDGKRIASGGYDDTVQVWDAMTENRYLTYTDHSGSPESLAWSPDGKRIASAGFGANVQVWNAGSGNHLLTYKYKSSYDYVWSVAWSPDGERMASAGNDATVQVLNTTTGRPLFIYQGHTANVESAAWSPDGKRIASAGVDKTVQVWEASTGNHLFTYSGHSDQVKSVTWSPDSRYVASASFDKTVQVWEASTGNHLFTYSGHLAAVYSVSWSPSGTWIASASQDTTVQVWLTLQS